MKEIVQLDIENIVYDQTEDKELYIYVIQTLIDNNMKKYPNQIDDLGMVYKFIEEIKNPTTQKEGRYKIPLKYVFEKVRSIEKDFVSVFNFAYRFFEVDNQFSKEYGETIQELWEDKTIRLGAMV